MLNYTSFKKCTHDREKREINVPDSLSQSLKITFSSKTRLKTARKKFIFDKKLISHKTILKRSFKKTDWKMHKLAKHKRSKTILALSRLYNKSDHNFYMSLESGSNPIRSKKSVLRSRWRVFLTNLTVVFLLLLVTSSLPHSVLASNTGWIDQVCSVVATNSIYFITIIHRGFFATSTIFANAVLLILNRPSKVCN